MAKKKELEKRIQSLESWVHYEGSLFVNRPGAWGERMPVGTVLQALLDHLGIYPAIYSPPSKLEFKKREDA